MIVIKKLIVTLIFILSLYSLGCSQDSLLGEYPSKIIVNDNEGKQVEIVSKKEIERINCMIRYNTWKELDSVESDFNIDISIVEEYKSSKSKSREISFSENSPNIKLTIDGKYTTWYEVEYKIYDEMYDSLLTILYNDSNIN